MRRIAQIVLSLGTVALIALTGCNTTAGLGQDVQGAGSAVEDTARDVQNDLN